MKTYWAKIKWIESIGDGKTIRRASYDGCEIEVVASEVGTAGDFAAHFVYHGPHFGPRRVTEPHWAKSAHEALDKACATAVNYVDCRNE